MALQTPGQLNPQTGHGIRPFSYKVEFAVASSPTTFANPQGSNWQQRLVNLSQVILAYGNSEQVARFETWDPAAIDPNSIENPEQWIKEPQNGEVVRVTLDDGTGPQIVFKGTIRSVHEVKQNSGVTWRAEAVSEASRLNEVFINANFNIMNDPINPSPRFDADGMVFAKLFNVKEIIDQIMGFKDAWGTTEYFTAASINWNGLDTDANCGLFKPSDLIFTNMSKAAAIMDTLTRAGNYTYLYDPAHDKISIIALNRACTSCGPQWDIAFVNTDANSTDQIDAYACDYTVECDNTEWTTKLLANVCRIIGGPLQFYSGHSIIPEMATSDQSFTDGTDTADMQRARAKSPDLTWYRFRYPTALGIHDGRERQRYIVGAPLFPDWNIYEDWWPAMVEIGDVQIPQEWRPSNWTADVPTQVAETPSPNDYKNRVEFQPFCIGDEVARGSPHLGYQDNMRVYQAWYSDAKCPACLGSGLVKKIYTNTANEPNITLVLKGPTSPTDLRRLLPEVSNYIFPPNKFGTITTVAAANAFGLVPFDATDTTDPVVIATGGYPLPWKNTCPMCRGVGQWPKWPIRNISPNLYASRNSAVSLNGPNHEILLDPDLTATEPETWEKANTRIALYSPPIIQVETPLMTNQYVLPVFASRNLPWTASTNNASLTNLPDTTGSPPTMCRRWMFPHPLQYQGGTTGGPVKQLSGLLVSQDSSGNWGAMPVGDVNTPGTIMGDGLENIVDPYPADPVNNTNGYGCYVPFTTIQMGSPEATTIDWKRGKVLFARPVFIPCHKPYKTIQILRNSKVMLEPNGSASTQSPARGFTTADDRGLPTGYWRPARVWMTFMYERGEHYYNNCSMDLQGQPIAPVTFTYVNADGITGNYKARAIIQKGNYCIEVQKVTPENNAQNTQMSADNRVIQTVMDTNFAQFTQVEVFEKDFWKMPCPTKPIWPATPTMAIAAANGAPAATVPNNALDPYIVYKTTTAHYDYPKGKILVWERTTPGEQMVEAAGYTYNDFSGAFSRPKPYSWYLKDDRPRLLNQAVRRLDMDDNVKVTGSLTLVGKLNITTTGLGWVAYPAKGNAAVVRLTYSFQDGFTTEVELEREQARHGELPPPEADRMMKVEKSLKALSRFSDAKASWDKANQGMPPERSNGNSILGLMMGSY